MFNYLLKMEVCNRNYSKFQINFVDSITNNKIQDLLVVHYLITYDQDNLAAVLMGHLSHSFNQKVFNSGYTEKTSQSQDLLVLELPGCN